MQLSDSGSQFSCVVTNAFGSILSSNAVLTVVNGGRPDSFNPGADLMVFGMAVQSDGKILVGGVFNTLCGQSRRSLGRLNADGTLDTSFNPGGGDIVYSLAVQADGKILVGGDFYRLCGQSRSHLGRLNADGTLDASFNPGADYDYVSSLVVQADGKILVGGSFDTLGGQSRMNLGRLNADGTLDTTFNPGTDSFVYSLAMQEDEKILVGGEFTTLGGQSRANLGRLNADGTLDTSFNPGANNPVHSLAVQADGKILVGGEFTTLGGQSRSKLGRLNADGTLDTTFNPGANRAVVCTAVQVDGKILVCGDFTALCGQSRTYLGRLNTNGALDTTFTTEANNSVDSLVVQPDGKILAGGWFTTLGGQSRSCLGRLTPTEPATQNLAFDGSTIIWQRGGSGPEVWRTTFDGLTNGSSWIPLGAGSRITGGWQLTGLTWPTNVILRARGFVASGDLNASGWFVETIGMVNYTPVIITYSNQPVVFFPTAAGTNFVLQMTTNSASGNWVTVTNGIPFSGLQVPDVPDTVFFRLNLGAQTVTRIAGGCEHSLFLKSDGSLWVVGDNCYGELGDGTTDSDNYNTNLPEQIVTGNVTAIAAGEFHSLFLKSDGSLWGMGYNYYGQLGDGNYNIETALPEQIVASNVTSIAAGENHSLFLKNDGSLWAMGYNYYGQLGDGTTDSDNYNTNQPEQIVAGNVTAIAAGELHSLFLKSNGSLWAMCNNWYGQLGDGSWYNTNQPELIMASNVTAIAAGGFHSLFLKSDGSLWAMGWNVYGELGDGTYNNANLPEQIVASNVTAIAAGGFHSLFLKSDGSLWAMGWNEYGQLGDGTYNNTNLPEQIVASNVTAIASGAGCLHSLFLKSDGSLWAMGWNEYGQLGDGTYNNTNLPEQIVALTALPMPVLGIGTYGSQPVVFFPSVATSINYWLLMTTNLASGNWVTVTNGIPFSGLEITDAPSPVFFRLY